MLFAESLMRVGKEVVWYRMISDTASTVVRCHGVCACKRTRALTRGASRRRDRSTCVVLISQLIDRRGISKTQTTAHKKTLTAAFGSRSLTKLPHTARRFKIWLMSRITTPIFRYSPVFCVLVSKLQLINQGTFPIPERLYAFCVLVCNDISETMILFKFRNYFASLCSGL